MMGTYFDIGLGVGAGIAGILMSRPGQYSVLGHPVPEIAGAFAIIAACLLAWPVALIGLAAERMGWIK